jgi:hypothetical protein
MSRLFATLLLAMTCISCQTEARQMNQPRIDKLFEKTKAVCFGRFVVDVPASAAVINGPQTFGASIRSVPHGAATLQSLVSKRVAELQAVKHEDVAGSLLREIVDGPTPGSKTVISWASSHATYLTAVQGYLKASPHGFIYEGGIGSLGKRKLEDETSGLSQIATHLRARDPAEVPQEPGACLDVGFIADDTGKFQEIFGIGLRFPELPDASFSISTNKDAQQGDSFEARRSEARRAALMVPELATAFSKIKTLREGKRKVQQGDGSEALFSRPLGSAPGHWHEFQFEYAGKRFDHRNPSWDAALFTGVHRDQAGSVPSSLSDEEAIALWDRLMLSVRLRVTDR